MKLFIDTSIFVDVLKAKQVESSRALLESLEDVNEGFTSAITVAELCVGAYRSSRKDALEKTLMLLSLVEVIDIDGEIAVESGRIYAELTKKGREIELNDCLIAATSLSQGISRIVTRDLEHFGRIKDVEAVTPEDLGF